MALFTALVSFLTILLFILNFTTALDSIPHFHSITDGKTLVSQAETFELGFFSPGNSTKRYLGIWYKNIPIQTVVWVANRANPINDSSGVLAVNKAGDLVLTIRNGTVAWSTRLLKPAQNPVAKLLDSGNLVLYDENEANPEEVLWQSFDYPTDTFLPGMKFGRDLKTGLNRALTAWKSPEDPSPSDFSWVMELRSYPESYLMRGKQKLYRSGPWNGMHPSGLPEVKSNPIYDYNYVFDKNEMSYTYTLKNDSVLSRLSINATGYLHHRYVWDNTDRDWTIYRTTPRDFCDTYAFCGAYGNCVSTESPMCQCFEGFEPKSPQQWNSMNWSQGCVRTKPLSCSSENDDVFVKFVRLKVPETTNAWVDETIGLQQCRERCLSNCSCMAYTNSDIRGGGSGCVMWFGDLIDIRQLDEGQDLYIRMAVTKFKIEGEHGHKKLVVATISSAISVMVLVGCYYVHKNPRKKTEKSKNVDVEQSNLGSEEDPDSDIPLLDLSTIAMATENFSIKNKIGQGGFGSVYRGRLPNGQQIAVKRLSKSSEQGMIEFKNEVRVIAKLQHRNIVKLLSCCIHGYEKMLVYEYMPNNSIDSYIFDKTKGKLLDWPKRFHIIYGIARGLLYLHEDSRLRIIHRDLKASNVLLDQKLNPKISDFGMAKIFETDETEGNTERVVGTYGYMAPEYASDGLFSIKSDVFSFGILMLEIITGKKNRGFFHPNYTINLIGYAWLLWNEGKILELIDDSILDSCNLSEVMRCIHVSLLCVQQCPEYRPAMSSVVLMLRKEIELTEPHQPGFFSRLVPMESANSLLSRWSSINSTNDMTITIVEAR